MKTSIIIVVLTFLSYPNVFSQNENKVFNLKSGKTTQNQAVFIDLFPSMEEVWEGKIIGSG